MSNPAWKKLETISRCEVLVKHQDPQFIQQHCKSSQISCRSTRLSWEPVVSDIVWFRDFGLWWDFHGLNVELFMKTIVQEINENQCHESMTYDQKYNSIPICFPYQKQAFLKPVCSAAIEMHYRSSQKHQWTLIYLSQNLQLSYVQTVNMLALGVIFMIYHNKLSKCNVWFASAEVTKMKGTWMRIGLWVTNLIFGKTTIMKTS